MSTSTLGFRSARARDFAGTLNLEVAAFSGVTKPVVTEFGGVLRLMQPLYLDSSGQVTYIVVNPGGAFFGENYRMNVDVAPAASLLLAAQGATRIYKTPVHPAVQEIDFQVGQGSRLEYMPDQTIPYLDADFRQVVKLRLASDSQAFIAEDLTPGWDPRNLQFTYSNLHLRVEVRSTDTDRLVLTDNVRMQPGLIGDDINGVGYMEGLSHMASILIAGPHTSVDYANNVRDLLDASGTSRAGVTFGERHGIRWVMVRALAESTDQLNKVILDVNEYDRSLTTGQARLDLRRY